jgi:hypothetical protein
MPRTDKHISKDLSITSSSMSRATSDRFSNHALNSHLQVHHIIIYHKTSARGVVLSYQTPQRRLTSRPSPPFWTQPNPTEYNSGWIQPGSPWTYNNDGPNPALTPSNSGSAQHLRACKRDAAGFSAVPPYHCRLVHPTTTVFSFTREQAGRECQTPRYTRPSSPQPPIATLSPTPTSPSPAHEPEHMSIDQTQSQLASLQAQSAPRGKFVDPTIE